MIRVLKPLVEKFPLIASYYRFRRDCMNLARKVEYRLALGFYFNGPVDMQDGAFEPQETILFEKLIGRFDLFVNVGANAGYYCCKALKEGVDVVAFEPNRLNINILLKIIEANGFTQVFHFFRWR